MIIQQLLDILNEYVEEGDENECPSRDKDEDNDDGEEKDYDFY